VVEPNIIVVACNTASTVVLPHIRGHFKVSVIGVVPAIKPAVAISKTGTIGLLGTPGTVKRDYTQRLIDDFAAHCNIVTVGSSRLVDITEQALRGIKPDRAELSSIIAPLFAEQSLDTIVLGCTHFPLINNELRRSAPRPVNWIDSGEAISRRVKSFCTRTKTVQDESIKFTSRVFFTDNTDEARQLRSAMTRFGCTDISYVKV
jgi:glutamate racemase